MNNISSASVYVGTYHKYNMGSISGEWLNLSDFSDKEEFYEACKRLHMDEADPEFMFQDYENIPNDLINESWISDKIFEVIQAISDIGDESEPFLIWCGNLHRNLADEDIDTLIGSFRDDYVGKYDSESDFATELIEERSDITAFSKQYFDYQAYANDLFSSNYWMEDGYVFRNC